MNIPNRKSEAGPRPRKEPKRTDSDDLMTIIQTSINCRKLSNAANSTNTEADDADKCLTTKRNFTTTEGRIKITSQIFNSTEVLCCKYNQSLNCIAGGYVDGTVKMYSSGTGEAQLTFRDPEVENKMAPCTDIQYRPLGTNYPTTNAFLCSYTSGDIKCWNYVHKKCIFTIKTDYQVLGLTYHPVEPRFLGYGDNGKIYLYNEETRTCEQVFQRSNEREKHDGHTLRVFAACFHPNSPFEFISASWDNVVQFWDLRRPNAVRHLFGIHVSGKGVDIDPTGREILVAAWQKENPLQLYDYSLGKLISTVEPDVHNSKLYCGCYVTKDLAITGGANPNLFRVIDLQAHSTIASVNYLPGAVYSMDIGAIMKTKAQKIEQSTRTTDISQLPRIAFASKKKIYEIEFT